MYRTKEPLYYFNFSTKFSKQCDRFLTKKTFYIIFLSKSHNFSKTMDFHQFFEFHGGTGLGCFRLVRLKQDHNFSENPFWSDFEQTVDNFRFATSSKMFFFASQNFHAMCMLTFSLQQFFL